MFKLLKNGTCYIPENTGKMDILICYDKICRTGKDIPAGMAWDVQVIDCSGRIICPGFIDMHVHITGGGGEQGPVSRIPEIGLSSITGAGVTTVVGVLGVDGVTRNISSLLAKALALQAEGITTYIYTGSYGVPTDTLTGKPVSDLVLIEKVIGIGEIAISDMRSSYPSSQLLKELASEASVGGMLGKKAGVMHVHVGDGRDGLRPLLDLIKECDFPVEMFVPTHLNRTKSLLGQAMDYAASGGRVDLTAGEPTGIGCSVPDALAALLQRGIPIENITVTSDGNGSIPSAGRKIGGVGRVKSLFEDIREAVLVKGLGLETVLKTVTVNPAKILKLYPQKGTLAVNSDADILIMHEDSLVLDKVIARGELMVDGGVPVKKGIYEE